jgi:hypothetical protein
MWWIDLRTFFHLYESTYSLVLTWVLTVPHQMKCINMPTSDTISYWILQQYCLNAEIPMMMSREPLHPSKVRRSLKKTSYWTLMSIIALYSTQHTPWVFPPSPWPQDFVSIFVCLQNCHTANPPNKLRTHTSGAVLRWSLIKLLNRMALPNHEAAADCFNLRVFIKD